MVKLFASASLAICLLAAPNAAFAAQQTVTLAVQNMYCEACPYMVKKSLERVAGVAKVSVSFKDKTVVVTYDDAKTDVKTLTDATAGAGYPSAPKS